MTGAEPLWRQRRRQDWAAARRDAFDLCVIGGGISGAGIAWQASTHGLRTLLVEARDWAGGTSSRSSKLVHGGLRYLPHGEVRLVREVGRERELLEKLWPHLVVPLPFLIPVYRGRGMPLWLLGAGVWFYDRLTGVPQRHRRRMLGADAFREVAGLVQAVDLQGGVSYYEAVTDDARLVYTVVQAARAAGAVALSRVRAAGLTLTPRGGRVTLEDVESGERCEVRVRAAVNAAGPWAGELDPAGRRLALARGCHLVFPREKLPIDHAIALPSPGGGNTFAVPRGPVTYVGTTDIPFVGDPALPDTPDEDVRYLLRVVRKAFPAADLSARDLLGVYSGVRPLVAGKAGQETRGLSRRRSIEVRRDGLVSVRGGKLTGFRSMAADTLRLLRRRGVRAVGRPAPAAATPPAQPPSATPLAERYHVPSCAAAELIARHGPLAEDVLRYAASRPAGLEPVVAGAKLLWGEVDWAAEREEVFELSDLLVRRTGLLWFGGLREPEEVLRPVAERIASRLGWNGDEIERQVAACRRQSHLDRLAELRSLPLEEATAERSRAT